MTTEARWGALLAVGGIVLASSSGARAQSCEPAAASVISVQGDVEVSGHDRAHWRDVQLNQVLCAGQQVRLMAKSRAVLKLPNETLIHLDEGSVFTLRAIESDKPAWLDLLRGAVHIISRVPRALNIRTPLVNAGIEGTEFALRVDPDQAELWVYEGRVRFSNTLGQLLIASGEAAAAVPGRPPERRIVIKPRRAVEWALYYPPLLDTRPESYPEALRPAMLAYRRNDFTAAFAALDGVPEGARDARYHTLRAGLLLSVGRVSAAEGDLRSAQRLDPNNGTAYALRSVIAVVRNEQEEALKLAAEAVRLAPGSATPYVARSYAEQSAFEIETARESLEKAAELAPEDALVWARLAEIELSLGDLDAALESARKAERLDPGLSRTQSVLGFAYLTRIEVDHAKTAFERAMALDPTDPLPWLGLGLARIREGDVDEGTQEIETAASLDPNNSLIRSYLGKAYFEQKRGGLASTEFEQAKLLDPKDPTPWFYDAIHKQTTNRPVEALHDLEKAIELNDNRAVYRSKLLLDQDLAARSANLARAYQDIGFDQRALLEGWRSVNANPADFSAHRFLANSYSALPRHEIARASEFLQSQLLQPLNITPIQAELAETNLAILESAGPSDPSYYELNPLYARNGTALQANALFGNNGLFADDFIVSGIKDVWSGSLGQYHYESNGFSDNTDLRHNIYDGFAQWTVNPDLSLQVELRNRRTTSGDLALSFLDRDLDIRQDFERELARIGGHYKPTSGQDFLASLAYITTETDTRNSSPLEPGFSGVSDMVDNTRALQIEVQHQYQRGWFNSIVGFGYTDGEFERRDVRSVVPFTAAFGPPRVRIDDDEDSEELNAYVYLPLHPVPNTTVTLGASYDSFKELGVEKHHINPKFGMIWNPFSTTTLRLAAFRVLKRSFASNQTIEPTQIAGFNQFFDDTNGTESTRYGVGIDQRIRRDIFAGVEASWRKAEVVKFLDPGTPSSVRLVTEDFGIIQHEQDEVFHRAYVYWMPTERISLNAELQFEEYDRKFIEDIDDGPDELRTYVAPIGVSYFHPSGFFAKLSGTYVDQEVEFEELVPGTASRAEDHFEDNFWVIDASLGYRLPKRYGIVSINFANLLDEEFRYQSSFNLSEPRAPRFEPERAIFARINLWYY